MTRIMKAMKQLLIVIGLMSILSLNAQTPIEYPVAQMHSTSAMVGAGSALPFAAGGDMEIGAQSPQKGITGPRRVIDEDDKEEEKPDGWQDPFKDPLTDAVPCLLLLAIGYAIYLGRKTSVPNPDSRK